MIPADSAYAASNAARAASYAAAYYANASSASASRFRVLATMAQAGVLPNPLTEKP